MDSKPRLPCSWLLTRTVLERLCGCVCACVRLCVCVFLRKPILYAFSADADLQDLTVFIMMMNKSKVFEEKKKVHFDFSRQVSSSPRDFPILFCPVLPAQSFTFICCLL